LRGDSETSALVSVFGTEAGEQADEALIGVALAARTMLRDLIPSQRRLADFMSELSEEAYYAGWMVGLEYALWDALADGRSIYGRLYLTDDHRARLIQLSSECGGWIVFDDATEETWLPMTEWQARFTIWKSTEPAVGGG
jgi:hypothetical protein